MKGVNMEKVIGFLPWPKLLVVCKGRYGPGREDVSQLPGVDERVEEKKIGLDKRSNLRIELIAQTKQNAEN